MKSLIKQLLRENLLSEDYDMHKQLDGLANDIFKAAIAYIVEKAATNKNALNIIDKIPFIFSRIPRKYPKLKEFMDNYDLSFKFRGTLKSKAVFFGNTEDNGLIEVRYKLGDIEASLKKYVLSQLDKQITQQIANEMISDVYFSLYRADINSSILHELQHAYDSWRSGGKYTSDKKSREYYKKYNGNDTELSNQQYDKYMKLQHEINARFAQAIKEIDFFKYNFDNDPSKPINYKILVDYPSVQKSFRTFFGGYNEMSLKVKKRLETRLYKIYNRAKEVVEKYNSELSMESAINETTPLLTENAIGKHLIVVDIQPEYSNWMGNVGKELMQYINQNYSQLSNLTFLYNGEETLGMINEYDYRDWLIDMGLDEEIVDNVALYDKGYAFFRNCMDRGGDEQGLVNLVKFMIAHDINDSRELDENFWNSYVEQYGNKDIRELMEDSDDCINIPDLMSFLEPFNNVVLVGGGINECLREVELAMDALDKNYETWNKFTY